jgi:hypothetical protein
MVAVADAALPSETEWMGELERLSPDVSRPTDLQVSEDIVTGKLGRATFAVALMPAPIPREEIEAACAASWFWPEAASVVLPHRAHLVVSVLGGEVDAVTRHLLLSRLVAAVAAAAEALGIYWASAGLVHKPADVYAAALEAGPETLPLQLWVAFRLHGQDEDSVVLSTQGLEEFGVPELEVAGRGRTAQEVYEFAFNVAHYVLLGGTELKDGETIGMSERQRVPIRHAPSSIDPSRTVIRLEL